MAQPRILVNCAGIAIAVKTLGKDGPHPLDIYRKVIEVNLIGTFNMIRLVADRHAASSSRCRAASAASSSTPPPSPPMTARSARPPIPSSKGGVVGMTLPVARDLARSGIRVMTIAPGIFRTPMMAGLPQEAQDSLGAAVPFPSRLGEPSEYAALALHIVENQMLNGETIRLDGAIRMAPK